MAVTFYRGEVEARLGLYTAMALGATMVFPYTDSWWLSSTCWLTLVATLAVDRFFSRVVWKVSIFTVVSIGVLISTLVPALMISEGSATSVFFGKLLGALGLAIIIGLNLYIFNATTLQKFDFELIGEG